MKASSVFSSLIVCSQKLTVNTSGGGGGGFKEKDWYLELLAILNDPHSFNKRLIFSLSSYYNFYNGHSSAYLYLHIFNTLFCKLVLSRMLVSILSS